MRENLFITFTGIAALVHSTWSLGTLFSGEAPNNGDWFAYLLWVLPAFFVAFAMDVGQISTSAEIRHHGLNWQRAVTFFVFALTTYYLQFLYIAHHMPLKEIAEGVSENHRWAVITARDASIWILPLFLPLSTLLYTLSSGDKKKKEPQESIITISKQEQPLIEEKVSEIESSTMLAEEIIQEPKYVSECEDCGWQKEYESPKMASRALNTHKSLHCPSRHELQEKVSQNGHNH